MTKALLSLATGPEQNGRIWLIGRAFRTCALGILLMIAAPGATHGMPQSITTVFVRVPFEGTTGTGQGGATTEACL